LDFISNGPSPQNPSELLMHDRFQSFLATLSEDYDHILIDSPPMLAVTDALIIGRSAHHALLVLESGAHSVQEIKHSVSRLQLAEVRLRGLVLNIADRRGESYGVGQYRYHYGAD
jgi:tyrosine-protein kinase Etk/Wzc